MCKVYLTIYDKNNEHYMFPNEARLRNMDYSMTIHYDVDVEFINILKEGEMPTLVGGKGIDIDELLSGDEKDHEIIEGAGDYTNFKTTQINPDDEYSNKANLHTIRHLWTIF